MIDIYKFPIGYRLEAETQNSLYCFERQRDNVFFVTSDNSRFEPGVPATLRVYGARTTNSFIANYIRVGMSIEMDHPNKPDETLMTSTVKSITVIGPGFEYHL